MPDEFSFTAVNESPHRSRKERSLRIFLRILKSISSKKESLDKYVKTQESA